MLSRPYPQVKVEQVEPPQPSKHNLAKAAIIGGAILGGSIGIGIHARGIASRQKEILQRAAKRAQGEGVRAANRAASASKKTAEKAAKTEAKATAKDEDWHVGYIEKRLKQYRSNIPHEYRPPEGTGPFQGGRVETYRKHLETFAKEIHGEIPDEAKIRTLHGTTPGKFDKKKTLADEMIFGIKTKRAQGIVERLKTEKIDTDIQSRATDVFYKSQLHPHFKKEGKAVTSDRTQWGPFADYEYSKPHASWVPKSEIEKLKKAKPTEMARRIVKLIQFDISLKESRGSDGKFAAGGGAPFPDAGTFQYAYHAPLLNPSSGFNTQQEKPRGRGRPPGALNKATVERQWAENPVVQEAIQQQPEMKQAMAQQAEMQAEAQAQRDAQRQIRKSRVVSNLFVAAGLTAGASIIAGPKIAKTIASAARDKAAVERIGSRLDRPLKRIVREKVTGVPVKGARTENRVGKNKIEWADNLVWEETGKRLGQRFVEKAAATGTPIETAIADRARNLRKLRQERLAKGADWARRNPERASTENPWTNAPYAPATKVDRDVAKANANAALSKSRLETAEQANRTQAALHTQDELQLGIQQARAETATARARISELTEAGKKQGEVIGGLEKRIEGSIEPMDPEDRLQVARNIMGGIEGRRGIGLPDEIVFRSQPNAKGELQPEIQRELANLQKHHKVAGKEFKITEDRTPPVQEELVKIHDSTLNQSVVPKTVLDEHIEYLKHRTVQNRADEINQIHNKYGLPREDIAHVMAEREAKGKYSKILERNIKDAPDRDDPDFFTKMAEHGRLTAREGSKIKKQATLYKQREAKLVKEMKKKYREAAKDEFRKQRNLPPGKRFTMTDAETKALDDAAKEGEKAAHRAHAKQLASEGAIPESFLSGFPVGTKDVTAKQIAIQRDRAQKSTAKNAWELARNILHRYELMRHPVVIELGELRPGMICL
jgi:hypothetical protein